MTARITLHSAVQEYRNVIACTLFLLALLAGAATVIAHDRASNVAVYLLFGSSILFAILGMLPESISTGYKRIMVMTGLLVLGPLACYQAFGLTGQWSVLIFIPDVILGLAAWQLQPESRPWQERLLFPLFLATAAPGLLWWPKPVPLWDAAQQAVLALGIGGGVWLALTPQTVFKGRLPVALVLTVFAILAFIADSDTSGIVSSPEAFKNILYNWGGYLGGVLQVQAGLVPFVDIPLMYGIGPTLFLDGLCHINGDCWFGMYCGVVILGVIYGLSLACSGLYMAGKDGRSRFIGITLTFLIAVFCLAGNPSGGITPAIIPSIGAMRFMPLALLVLALSANRNRLAGAVMFLASLWSLDMAVMSLVTFGGVMIARNGLLRGSLIAGGVLAAAEIFMVLAHRFVTGEFMDIYAYLEYLINIPTPLPLNPFGALPFFAGVVWFGVRLLQTPPADPVERQRDVTAVCAMLAAFLYCVGRGHDNNILNISPFMLLVAVRMFSRSSEHAAQSRLAIASAAAIIGFSTWVGGHPFSAGGPSGFDALRPALVKADSDVDKIAAAIKNPQHLPVFMPSPRRGHVAKIEVWTPLDPWPPVEYLPPERLQVYVQRAALRLKKSGWIAAPADQIAQWENIYGASYDIAGKQALNLPGFPPLTAIRLVPVGH